MLSINSLGVMMSGKAVLRDITMDMPSTGLVALLGPNGAGKSTLLRCIAGLSHGYSGDMLVDNTSLAEFGRRWYSVIGYAPDRPSVPSRLSVSEYLEFIRIAKGVSPLNNVNQLVQTLNLDDVADIDCKMLSLGYSQRVSVAQAFIGNPKVVLLDEPMQSLDPEQLVRLREFLLAESKLRLIIMSSHQISELIHIASSYYVLQNGALTGPIAVSNHIESDYLALVRNQVSL